MNRIIFIVLIVLVKNIALSQINFELDEMIVIATEVNMRDKPSINANVIKSIQNGEIIYPQHEESVREQIGDYGGSWLKVLYQGSIGYVYSKYVGPRYMLFYEDREIGYYPKVKYWYGVYRDANRREVIKKIKTYTDEDTTSYNERIILKSNQASKSILLIASNEDLPEKTTGIVNVANPNELLSLDLKIGEEVWLGSIDGSISYRPGSKLIATGKYEFNNDRLNLSDYQVFIYNENGNSKRQNISQYLYPPEYLYKLVYTGDIDGDGNSDIILRSCSNSGCVDLLFLSSLAKENEFVRPISYWFWEDDC